MSTLKNNKILQLLLGISSNFLLLMGCYLLGGKITFPETAFWNIAEPIILIAYMLIYMASLSFLAIFAKSSDLKFLYYPAFTTCLASVLCAILHWNIEDFLWLIVMPLTKHFGMPIRAFAKEMEKATTYFNISDVEEVFLWEYDTLIIFLLITLVSLVAYQLYTATEDQTMKKARWRLRKPSRTIALTLIFSFGIFDLFVLIANLSFDFIILDIIYMVLGVLCMALVFTGVVFVIPFYIIPYMIFTASKQARESRNPRQIFNPLILVAVIFALGGVYLICKTVMSGF